MCNAVAIVPIGRFVWSTLGWNRRFSEFGKSMPGGKVRFASRALRECSVLAKTDSTVTDLSPLSFGLAQYTAVFPRSRASGVAINRRLIVRSGLIRRLRAAVIKKGLLPIGGKADFVDSKRDIAGWATSTHAGEPAE